MVAHIHCLQNQTWLHTPCLIEHITFCVLISEVVPPCVPTLMKLDATKLSNATMIKGITGKNSSGGKEFLSVNSLPYMLESFSTIQYHCNMFILIQRKHLWSNDLRFSYWTDVEIIILDHFVSSLAVCNIERWIYKPNYLWITPKNERLGVANKLFMPTF